MSAAAARRRRAAKAVPLSWLVAGLERAVDGVEAAPPRPAPPLPAPLAAAFARAGLPADCTIPETVRLEGIEFGFAAKAEPEALAAWESGSDLTLFVPRPPGLCRRLSRRIRRWIARPPPPRSVRFVRIRVAAGDRARVAFEDLPANSRRGQEP